MPNIKGSPNIKVEITNKRDRERKRVEGSWREKERERRDLKGTGKNKISHIEQRDNA